MSFVPHGFQVFESSDEEEGQADAGEADDIVLNIVVGSGTSLSNRPNLANKIQVHEVDELDVAIQQMSMNA